MTFRDKIKTFIHSYVPFLLPAIRCGIRYSSLIVDPKRRKFQMNLWRVKWLDWGHGTNFGDRLYWDEIGTTKERANDYSPVHFISYGRWKRLAQEERTLSPISDAEKDTRCT